MVNAIVTSFDKKNLMALPLDDIDPEKLVGKSAYFVDQKDRIWPGKVDESYEQFVIIKFEKFPYGIGQGHLLEIKE